MENSLENGQVIIRKRGADRIRRGHLWVYRSDVVDTGKATPGGIVEVREERGKVVGKAFYSSTSQIALRFLTRSGVPSTMNSFDIDSTWQTVTANVSASTPH